MREGTFRLIALLLFVGLIYYGYELASNQLGYESDLNRIVANYVEPEPPDDPVTGEDLEVPAGTEGSDSSPVLAMIDGSGSDFFIDYKLERERTRSYQAELLNGLVNNPKVDDASRREAAQQLLLVASTVEREMEVENLIKAKGFADSLIMLTRDSVVVIVKAAALGEVEVARIVEVVTKSTGVKMDKIVVLPKG